MTLYFHADYLINYQVFLDSENLKTSSAAYFGGILKVIGHRTFKVIELFLRRPIQCHLLKFGPRSCLT